MAASAAEEGEMSVATMDDLPAVQDTFGDVYAGVDYLYSTFSHVVQGPGAKAFLYKIKDELVAFAGTILVDDGQALVSIAGRVKDGYRDQGVFGCFRQMIRDHFSDRTLYPKLCREMQTTNETTAANHGDKMKKSGWQQINLKHIARVTFPASKLSSLTVQEAPSRPVTVLTQDDLQQLFTSDPSQWLHLFPEKRLVVAWRPYSVMAENLPIILNGSQNTIFYGTTASECSLQPRSLDSKFSLLSAGSYYTCPRGICYFVDVFGTAGDRKEVEDHINTHLQRLKDVAKSSPGNVIFHSFAVERLDEIMLNTTRQLETFSVADFFQVKMQLLERDW